MKANSNPCCCCCCCYTYSKAAFTNCACWATSPPILFEYARYSLNGPATMSSKPATLMLLLDTLTGGVAVAEAGTAGGGGGGVGNGSVNSFTLSTASWGTSSGADGGAAISVCSKRSTSVSRRSQILSKCSTAAVGFVSVSLSVKSSYINRDRHNFAFTMKFQKKCA